MALGDLMTPRRISAVVVAGALGWLAVSVGTAGVLRARDPVTALKFWPWDARARANLADARTKLDPSNATLAAAAGEARKVLARDATNSVAVRLLAAGSGADKQLGLYRLAEKLNRRDIATQLWLIEEAVGKDQVDKALVHYDVALRTEAAAPPLLFPILSGATGDPRLLPQITTMLARKPDWATPFLFEAVNSGPDSGALLGMFRSLKKSGFPVPGDLSANLLKRVVRDNRMEIAPEAYALAGGNAAGLGQGVNDGGFNRLGGLQPFDWDLRSENGLYAEQRPSDATKSGQSVSVRAESGASGDAARQLLLLKPGKYRLTFTTGNVPAADVMRLNWTIRCAKSEVMIADTPVEPSTEAATAFVDAFSVPASACEGQYLSLAVRAETSSDGDDPWVGDVAIDRIG